MMVIKDWVFPLSSSETYFVESERIPAPPTSCKTPAIAPTNEKVQLICSFYKSCRNLLGTLHCFVTLFLETIGKYSKLLK